jgi:hypothetical protein
MSVSNRIQKTMGIYIPMPYKLSLIGLTLLLLTSCAGTLSVKEDAPGMVAYKGELPECVAVMPFQGDSDEGLVRKAFAANLSSKNYVDPKLQVVDTVLSRLKESSGKGIYDLEPQEISKYLDCDGLVYGRITGDSRIDLGVYSQVGVSAEIWMIDGKTGKELFRINDSVSYRSGGIPFPFSPLNAVTLFTTAMNVRHAQQIRVINELGYLLAERVPSPATAPIIAKVQDPIPIVLWGKSKFDLAPERANVTLDSFPDRSLVFKTDKIAIPPL